jgi:hypothetical protein
MFIQKKLNPFSSTKTSDEKIIKHESYPYLNYRLIPNQSTKTTNRLGFRGVSDEKNTLAVMERRSIVGYRNALYNLYYIATLAKVVIFNLVKKNISKSLIKNIKKIV